MADSRTKPAGLDVAELEKSVRMYFPKGLAPSTQRTYKSAQDPTVALEVALRDDVYATIDDGDATIDDDDATIDDDDATIDDDDATIDDGTAVKVGVSNLETDLFTNVNQLCPSCDT